MSIAPPSNGDTANSWFVHFVDDELLVTGGWDGSLALLDAKTGELRSRFDPLSAPIANTSMSPDGQRIALATGARIQIRNMRGDITTLIDGAFRATPKVAWSADGKRIAVYSSDWDIGVWNTESGARVADVYHPFDGVQVATWTSDGRLVFLENVTGIVHTWTEGNDAISSSFQLPKELRRVADLDPAGGTVAGAGLDGAVVTFDAVTGKRLRTTHMTGTPAAISFSHDPRWLAVGSNAGARVIDLTSGKVSALCGTSSSEIRWSKGGDRFLANNGVSSTTVCNSEGKAVQSFEQAGVELSPNGARVVLESDGDLSIRKVDETSTPVPIGPAHLNNLRFTSAGPRALWKLFDQLSVEDLVHHTMMAQVKLPQPSSDASPSWLVTAISPDGSVFGAVTGGEVSLYDMANTSKPSVLETTGDNPTSMAIGPRGSVAITFADGVHLWQHQQERVFAMSQAANVHFSADEKLLAASSANDIYVWDVDTGKLAMHQSANGTVSSLEFSPSGADLFASANGAVVAFGLVRDLNLSAIARIIGLLPDADAAPARTPMWLRAPPKATATVEAAPTQTQTLSRDSRYR